MSTLQDHRMPRVWQCGICQKVIHGTRNTIHLGVIAHVNKELREGQRKPNVRVQDRDGDLGTISLKELK